MTNFWKMHYNQKQVECKQPRTVTVYHVLVQPTFLQKKPIHCRENVSQTWNDAEQRTMQKQQQQTSRRDDGQRFDTVDR